MHAVGTGEGEGARRGEASEQRDLERVARRHRDVVRAHARAASVAVAVVEPGRIGEGAVAESELAAGGGLVLREVRDGPRGRLGDRVRGVVRGHHHERRAARPRTSSVRPGASRSCSRAARRPSALTLMVGVGWQPLDGGQRRHDLRGAGRRERRVIVVRVEDLAGAGVGDDPCPRRRRGRGVGGCRGGTLRTPRRARSRQQVIATRPRPARRAIREAG